MVESESRYDTRVMADSSDDEEQNYNFKTLFKHMHSESKRHNVAASCDVAKSAKNMRLNRYNNVSPYDNHRVILEKIDDHDYINASVAHSSTSPDLIYLLAQGPLERTLADFWRMTWEKNSKNIVMLNKLIENSRNKCARYWPEEVGHEMQFEVGNIIYKVTLLEEEFDSERFIIRRLELRQITDNSEEIRDINHFHYIGWPDFGVPDTPRDFGDFFHTLEKHRCFSDPLSPSIVHCSAGIGRTGTLILVDSCLKKLRKEQPQRALEFISDIIPLAYEEIIYLRQFRMGLIQTADQLEFSIRSIEYLHNDHLRRLREESLLVTVSGANGDGTRAAEENPVLPSGASRTDQTDVAQTVNQSESTSGSEPESPDPPSKAIKIEDRDVQMNRDQRQVKIEEIRAKMKKIEKSQEFWDTWRTPLIISGIAALSVISYFGYKSFYAEIDQDMIDGVKIEDEL